MDIGKIFSSRWGAVGATGALLAGLLLLNAAAIREIVVARKEARQIAQHELEIRLEGRGQALRARLADLRSDLVALAESAPFKGLAERMVSTDPLVRRWARLDAEGSLLLFAQSRPAVQVIWLTIGGGAGDVVVGRHGGVAVVVDPQTASPPRRDGVTLMQMSLGAEPETSLRGWVDPILILDDWTDFSGAELSLQTALPNLRDDAGIEAAVEIEDPRWDPPIHVWLVARQEQSQVERSIEALAGRFRRTVLWNLVVVLAASAAIALALVQMRRRVLAEAEVEHQHRIRELERGLLHTERLASVGRFAAGVAHEVNNPLEGMSNYLKLLEGDLEHGRSAEARDRLYRVREGLDRAAAVVRRVLTFSDPARAPREDLPIIESVREAVEFLQPRFPNVEIEIVSHDGNAVVRANRVALGQLFLNILLNASEVQEDGGRIEVVVDEYNATVMVSISDRGPGLTEEALDHLFEPFFSTRGSRGLGLAVCHGIVQEHGGEIAAKNAPDGKGAVFEVRLPKSSPSRVEES